MFKLSNLANELEGNMVDSQEFLLLAIVRMKESCDCKKKKLLVLV